MFQANYPVIGIQECYPVYLTGIGISESGISHASRGRINISSNIIYNVGQRKNNCW